MKLQVFSSINNYWALLSYKTLYQLSNLYEVALVLDFDRGKEEEDDWITEGICQFAVNYNQSFPYASQFHPQIHKLGAFHQFLFECVCVFVILIGFNSMNWAI